MNKLSSDDYTFVVEQKDDGVHITLTQAKTGRTKTFFRAVHVTSGLTAHMNSLTDDQCKAWFK